MSIEANKALLRRYYDELWCKGNDDAADELLHPEFNDPELPADWPSGVEGFKRLVREWRQGFPDMRETVEHMIAEGDKVVGYFRMRGTHEGEFFGIAPTGKRVEMVGADVARIANGKIAELWYAEDLLGLYRQLGAVEG